MDKHQKPRFLFVVDFDQTISMKDTGTFMLNLFESEAARERLWESYNVHQDWPRLMQEALDELHREGRTPDEIALAQREIPILHGMQKFIQTIGNRSDCDFVISSDANVLFINTLLQQHKLDKHVQRVLSNRVERDPKNSARLVFHPHDENHGCRKCPENMCKKNVLKKLLASQRERGVTYRSVFVVGDGENDHCQTALLGSGDYVMPRVGYPLHDLCEDMKKKDNSQVPTVLPWADGEQSLSKALGAIKEAARIEV